MIVLRLSHVFLCVVTIQCHSDMGIPLVLGIPIPKTLVIWTSPSHITLAIWVRVWVTGDAHITRVLGMGMTKTRGCPYQCDIGTLQNETGSS